jgi:hypothetical protein
MCLTILLLLVKVNYAKSCLTAVGITLGVSGEFYVFKENLSIKNKIKEGALICDKTFIFVTDPD